MRFPARLSIPDAVLKIARQLETAGYETWCVGGAIRDNLLGVENHDFDLTTAAPPAEVQRLFKRTVPVGIEHGTVAVLDRGNHAHEVTTFRKHIKTDGRHAVVEFGVSLMDDPARRDFTINAIAYHPIRHEWRDPFKGADDLEHKLIRSVGTRTGASRRTTCASCGRCASARASSSASTPPRSRPPRRTRRGWRNFRRSGCGTSGSRASTPRCGSRSSWSAGWRSARRGSGCRKSGMREAGCGMR